ncbi:MAG: S8 family peptidase [Aquabacterium sp.]
MFKRHSSAFLLTALALACQTAAAQATFNPTTGEYNWSTTVKQLGMRNIHSAGILGEGVIIGLLDTGINLLNPEFSGNSRVLTGYNAADGSTNVTDSIGHGTHIAGILAAPGDGSGMYGVAPMATLLPVKVFSGETAASSAINRGIDYAVSRGARVINLSLGAPGATGETSLRTNAAANNTVVVVSAGNESMSTPSWPGRYAKESWANGTIIVVGAVDSSRRMASFTNKAGDTAQFYLVAPGVNIISSYSTGYAYLTGTSMAAPAVSGAAALITGYWPYLRANQVAAILLNTADDLGAPGVDAVYGRGMLNVNRALSPIGSYTYRTPNGGRTTVSLSVPGVASTQPQVSTPSAFAGLVTEVFDAYGRNFTSDEGAALSARSVMTVDSILGNPNHMLDAAERVMANGTRLTQWQWHTQRDRRVDDAALQGISGAPWNHLPSHDASLMRMALRSGQVFSAGDGGMSSLSFGLMDSPMAARLSGTENLLNNPLFGFAPTHRFAAMSLPLHPNWRARVGLAQGQSAPMQSREAASGDVQVAELAYAQGNRALNLSVGQLREAGLLGGYGSAALGLNQTTQTLGMTLSAAWSLSPQWMLTGAFSQTGTHAPAAQGMLLSATPVRSQAYGLGLVRSDTWRDGDRLSLSVNAPLHARSGRLDYSVVTSVNEEGEPIFGRRTVQLAPTAKEWRVEARYATRVGKDASLSAAALLRLNPDHDGSAPAQTVLGLRYNVSF